MGKKDDPNRWRTDQEWDSGLERLGFEFIRQSGSHKIRRREKYTVILPVGHSGHGGEISLGVRKSLLRVLAEAGLLCLIAGLAGAFLLHFVL